MDLKYYWGSFVEYERLAKVLKIDSLAALVVASWGMFQMMSFNFAACSFRDVFAFTEAMKCDEAAQLEAFAVFLENRNLISYLHKKD